MKISTKGIYGLQAMVDLARYSNTEQVTLKSISERQDISEKYLQQIFSMLRKAELVKGIKGSQGGYLLGRDASDMTVGDILRTLEGQLLVVEAGEEQKQSKMEYLVSKNVWNKMNVSINEVVDGITLEDLVEEYRKMEQCSCDMYYI